MGMLGNLNNHLKEAKDSTNKNTEQLVKELHKIIDRLNWVMKSNQKICDHLKIKLDDPLDMEG